jgi:glutathione S-transferase
MKLFDNAFSPYAFKVRACLYEKGIPVDAPGLRTAAERAELRRLNPRDEVPTLVDGDAVISDSTVICEYIEDQYPSPPLMPRDPALRARCRGIEGLADGDLDGCLYVLGILHAGEGLVDRFSSAVTRAGAMLREHHARLDAELGDREYFLGDLSLADLAVYPHLRGGQYLGIAVGDDRPRLKAWMERMKGRPAIRRALREMAQAFEQFRTDPDPFFARGRVHWRAERLEWAVRFGLGPWILDEVAAGRAFFSPAPSQL